MAEPIKPAKFAPRETAQTVKPRHSDRGALWILGVTAALLLIIGIAWWWLSRPDEPAPKATPPASPPSASLDTPAGSVLENNPATIVKPEPQNTARKQAQVLLGDALKLSKALQTKGVTRWANAAFSAATNAISEGDARYRQADFQSAINHYQQAKNSLQQLSEDSSKVFREYLDRAANAIDRGDDSEAKTALDSVALIAPQDSELALLQQRLAVLPQVKKHRQKARQAQTQGNIAAAIDALKRVQTLDKHTPNIAQRIATLENEQRQIRYRQAMSQGFKAMQAKQYASAVSHFKNARAITNNQAAANALREARQKQTNAQLKTLKRSAKQAEAKEQWQVAHDAYQQALALDSTLTFAKQGVARSKQRLQLLDAMQKRIDNPAIINSGAKENSARQLLAKAQQVSPQGSNWRATLQQFENAIALASTPLPLFINSDGLTEIRVSTVGQLGTVQSKTLTLRPGRYTLIGSRRGYREVRQQVIVAPGKPMPKVTLICTEAIP